ncbi:hypothetical protein ANO14919_065260 [Xylariales sp. No.14919]|nr:hypothetical protein ANO14919_065260 [Xylariales sp. No.14919]
MAPRKQTRQQPLAAEAEEGTEATAQSNQPSQQIPDGTATSEWSSQQGLKLNLPPIRNVYQAFQDMLSKRQPEIIEMASNGGFQLRVGTICSGTEAPIFSLKLIKETSQQITNDRPFMQFEHLFSVENEPFKQAYISRNAPGSIVFRDVVDFADRNATAAPTILGTYCEIPLRLDLLVAGTSCVDFSTLNSRKKNGVELREKGADLMREFKNSNTLREDYFNDVREWFDSITPAELQAIGKSIGESSTTFLATMLYINYHRPKMVILENVYGAPWSSIEGMFFRAAGYAATYVAMDTKDYYLPQTRNRVYLVAVDRSAFPGTADRIINEWATIVRSLKRGASTPMQDWLLSSNDPLTIRARQDESEKTVSNSANLGRDSSWQRSKLRHARLRRSLELGNDHPLTAWGQGGTEQPYDRLDRLVIKGQNDRALDLIDIYFLTCLRKGGYDIRYKSQIIDLSQNADRSPINNNFGITGCLTPRGMNLITDQARLVTGYEALNLQGLPLRDLDLTMESQDELRDLAGNAMSTTVVGAALFSLLLAVHKHPPKDPPFTKITPNELTILSYQPSYQPSSVEFVPAQTWCSARDALCNMGLVRDLWKRCRRYCYCNGGAKYSTEELSCCEVCGIIRCVNCAGNPKHQFRSMPAIKDPIMNDTTPQAMMELFPTALKDIIGDAIDHISIYPELEDPELRSMLLRSLRSVTFYYTRVLISETVTVCYSAKDSECSFHLQAAASDRGVMWYLFLDPWSHCGKLLSEQLGVPPAKMSRPFGRARICADAKGFIPAKNEWEFWVFDKFSFDLELSEPCPGSIGIEFTSLTSVPAAAYKDMKSIIGTYDHHPECDAAENSLHVSNRDHNMYLFKDPARIGLPMEDCYIISDGHRVLENHEFRDLCVKFPPKWTPQVAESRVKAYIEGYWEKAVANNTHSQATFETSPVTYTRRVGSRDIPIDSDKLHGTRTLACVGIESNMLDGTFMTLSKYEQAGPDGWAVVLRSDYSALFDLLAPVNINLSGIEYKIPSVNAGSLTSSCPKLPDVHWMEKTIDGTKKSDRTVREPHRLSSEMHAYEEKLRGIDEHLKVCVNIKNHENKNGWKEVRAHYEVNVDLLMCRAWNHLPRPKDPASPVETYVEIKREPLNIPNLKFESFGKSLRRLTGESPRENIEYSKLFTNGRALTKQQENSLNWMLNRELEPPSFTEREIEECRFDPLNLRILAVAQRLVSRPGGILADDVGYGKTIVTLALMAAQQEHDQRKCQEKRAEGDTSALAASLVIVPRHLVDQWHAEAAEFLGWSGTDVLVIRSSRALQDRLDRAESGGEASSSRAKKPKTAKKSTMLLDELRAAKLIILSAAVFDEPYYTWLGKYAGAGSPPRAIPRTDAARDTNNPNALGAFQDWYEDATAYARQHLSGFNPAIFNTNRLEIIEQRQKSLQDSWKNVVADYYDASTRLGRQITRPDKTGELVNGREEGTTVDAEYGDVARVNPLTKEDLTVNKGVYVLEAFSFARVIYDEFSYENFCVALFLKNANAGANWVLSATPPTSNVRAVCDIAQLLKIHVARPVKLRPGLPRITEGPIVLRQNSTEKQLSYAKFYTDKSVQERVEQAHEFLRHFASANQFDDNLGDIKVIESVICSHMTRLEFSEYLDLQRDLRDSNLEISDLLKRYKINFKTTNEFPVDGRIRAGLALILVASVNCMDDDHGDVSKLLETRRRNLGAAQKELKRITNVAIWLALRRFQEGGNKKNESATNIVNDLACHFESILNENEEDFGGADVLKAISDSVFNEKQRTECSRWLESVEPSERTSETFFENLFTFLNEQMGEPEWVNYFDLPVDRIDGLRDEEVSTLIRELCGPDHNPCASPKPRERLKKLVGKKQSLDESNEAAKDDGNSRPKYPRFGIRKKIRGGDYTETESEITDIMLKLVEAKEDVATRMKQYTTASNIFSKRDECECSACGQPCDDLHFLPDCGHFICSNHLEVRFCGQIKSSKHPNGNGCFALIHKRSISVKQLDRCPIPDPLSANAFGGKPPSSKSQKIVHKINEILGSGNDRMLVFHQFEEQKEEICHLLEYEGIAYDDHPRTGVVSPVTEHSSAKERVRILKLNSEEAAGSNFQDANHVMFVSAPVFEKQEEFEKYVKQAKGRVVRHGQLKTVHIYYFVTANTFEVDLLQLRKKSTIVIGEKGVGEFVNGKQNSSKDHHADEKGFVGIDEEGDTQMTSGINTSC